MVPGDDRLHAFQRAYVSEVGTAVDDQALADLRRGDADGGAFSLYVNARDHYGASITLTYEGGSCRSETPPSPWSGN
jgi:hypothetical protein